MINLTDTRFVLSPKVEANLPAERKGKFWREVEGSRQSTMVLVQQESDASFFLSVALDDMALFGWKPTQI